MCFLGHHKRLLFFSKVHDAMAIVISGINNLSGQPEERYVITLFDLFTPSMLVMRDKLGLASVFPNDVR